MIKTNKQKSNNSCLTKNLSSNRFSVSHYQHPKSYVVCWDVSEAPPSGQKRETFAEPQEMHTKSLGESACSPPIWMKLPSVAKFRCRCSGIADLAILFGMWEPTRNSLFRSSNFTWRATASFLCRVKKHRAQSPLCCLQVLFPTSRV